MISIVNISHTNRQNHHSSYLNMPYWLYSSQRNISSKLVSTQDRDFPGFLPVGMRGRRGWILSPVYQFPTARNLHHALMSVIIPSHKITSTSCQGGVVNVSDNTQQYYAGVQNACLLSAYKWRVLMKVSFSLHIPIFKWIQINTYTKNRTKVVLIIFEINLKIN